MVFSMSQEQYMKSEEEYVNNLSIVFCYVFNYIWNILTILCVFFSLFLYFESNYNFLFLLFFFITYEADSPLFLSFFSLLFFLPSKETRKIPIYFKILLESQKKKDSFLFFLLYNISLFFPFHKKGDNSFLMKELSLLIKCFFLFFKINYC